MLRSADSLGSFVHADPLALRLAEVGRAVGLPLVLVGGVVRDWLLDRPALDWDVIVPGDPAPLLATLRETLGRHAVTLDASFGVHRLVMPEGQTIDFTRMHGATVEDDLRRRDLTINALGCSLEDGVLLDPTGGLADLAAGRIRAISRQNLVDDPVRLLRVFRFAATLPGEVETDTLAWARELAPLAVGSAGERVWAELGKLLAVRSPLAALKTLAGSGLLDVLVPAGGPAALERAEALFAAVARLDARGQAALHEQLSADRPCLATLCIVSLLRADPRALALTAKRLRWSKRELAWAQRAAEAARQMGADAPDTPRTLFRWHKSGQEALPGAVALGLSWNGLGGEQASRLLAAHWAWQDAPPVRLLDGHALMQELGVPGGPRLAHLLAGLEEASALGELTTRPAALVWAADWLQAQPDSAGIK